MKHGVWGVANAVIFVEHPLVRLGPLEAMPVQLMGEYPL